jgi:hypothetical protein
MKPTNLREVVIPLPDANEWHKFGGSAKPPPLVVSITELDAAFTLWEREYRAGRIEANCPPPLLGQRNDPLHGEMCRHILMQLIASLGNKDAKVLALRKPRGMKDFRRG